MSVPSETERVIFDAPAKVTAEELNELVRQVDIIIIPGLPSSIDIHAVTRFIEEFLVECNVGQKGVNVGIIANRAKKTTMTYRSIERFLKSLKLPFITTLRDTQNYVHASENGIGNCEIWDKKTDNDKEQWEHLTGWLDNASAARLMPQMTH